MPRKPKCAPTPLWGSLELSNHELKYSEEEWDQPSCDTQGHFERISVRVPPQVASELGLILEHFRTLSGYRTIHDVVRHALIRHIAFVHEIEPTIKRTYLGALQAMQLVLVEDRPRAETEALFRALEQRVDGYIEKGDRGEATRLIYEVKRRIDNTPDTPWKRRWLERYRTRYAHYLAGGAVPEGDVKDATRDAALDAPVKEDDTIN